MTPSAAWPPIAKGPFAPDRPVTFLPKRMRASNEGGVRAGSLITHSFLLENDSSGPLTIERVQPACSCTIAAVGKKTVPPGADTSIRITLDTKGLAGNASKKTSVLVSSGDRRHIVQLTLEGSVVVDERVFPDCVDFGVIEPGQRVSRFVEIRHTDPGFRILGVDTDCAADVRWARASHGSSAGCKLEIVSPKGSDQSKVEGHVFLHTNDRQRPIITIAIRWRCLPHVRLETESLLLEVADPNGIFQGTVEVLTSSEEIQDVRFDGTDDFLGARWLRNQEAGRYFIHANVRPRESDRVFYGVLCVEVVTKTDRYPLKLRVCAVTDRQARPD